MKVQLPVRAAILRRRTYEPPAEGRAGKIRLDFNENTAGCSPAVLRALARLTAKQIAMYPEYQRSTARLAKFFGIRASELLLTNGGDDALRVFFDAFVQQRSSILICEPTFPMYRYYAEIYGARVSQLRYGKNMDFPLADALRALKKRPRVLFIANPNNPTGTLLSLASIKRILASATHTAVVIDEAYAEFSGITAIPWVPKYSQLFVARTFSKAAGLAGLRLGAVIAQKRSVDILKQVMPPFPVNLAVLVAAEAALRDKKAIRSYVRTVKKLRASLAAALKKLGVGVYPSAGNFLLADFGPRGPKLFRKLESNGILLRDRSKDIAPGFVRISIGTPPEMQKLIYEVRKEYERAV
jgi:histidinol-phosphate aminotransferase